MWNERRSTIEVSPSEYNSGIMPTTSDTPVSGCILCKTGRRHMVCIKEHRPTEAESAAFRRWIGKAFTCLGGFIALVAIVMVGWQSYTERGLPTEVRAAKTAYISSIDATPEDLRAARGMGERTREGGSDGRCSKGRHRHLRGAVHGRLPAH